MKAQSKPHSEPRCQKELCLRRAHVVKPLTPCGLGRQPFCSNSGASNPTTGNANQKIKIKIKKSKKKKDGSGRTPVKTQGPPES